MADDEGARRPARRRVRPPPPSRRPRAFRALAGSGDRARRAATPIDHADEQQRRDIANDPHLAEGGDLRRQVAERLRAADEHHHAEEHAHRRQRDDEAVQARAHDQHAVDRAERRAERERADDRERQRQRRRARASQPMVIAAQTPMAPTERLSPPVTITTIIEKPIMMSIAIVRPSVKRLNGEPKPGVPESEDGAEDRESARSVRIRWSTTSGPRTRVAIRSRRPRSRRRPATAARLELYLGCVAWINFTTRQIRLAVVSVSLLTLAAVVSSGVVWLRTVRAIRESAAQSASANDRKFTLSQLQLSINPGFRPILATAEFQSIADFDGSIYVCSQSALFQYDSAGKLLRTWIAGQELPGLSAGVAGCAARHSTA